jgi:hypothetical protein
MNHEIPSGLRRFFPERRRIETPGVARFFLDLADNRPTKDRIFTMRTAFTASPTALALVEWFHRTSWHTFCSS